jgi:hypothetical protein
MQPPLALQPDETLADFLDLLLPPPSALIDGATRASLLRLGGMLPPIPRIAVECRLAAGARQVDLQLCARREEGEYEKLARHAASLASNDGAHARLALFLATLADERSALHEGVEELFLEYDRPEGGGTDPLPGVFISLPDEPRRAMALCAGTLALLRPTAPSAALIASVRRCFLACQGDTVVSHLGLMPGRAIDAVRLNIKGLRIGQADAFLERCGWLKSWPRTSALFAAAAVGADRVTLALDVGDRLFPRLGLECFLDEQPAQDPAWRKRLDSLSAAGLCCPDKAEAFLRVPTDILPGGAGSHWPASLIVQSLLGPENEFVGLARRAVHVKITETMGAGMEAKAYFGAGTLRFSPAAPSRERRWRPTLAAPRPRRSLAGVAPNAQDPIERGVRFLLETQPQSGLWRDFNVPSGISDEWVSGFVGTQLARTGDGRARSAAEECFLRLAERQRPNGGWAYNAYHPTDADSTSWALRLASALGFGDDPMVARGQAFIAGHLRPEGGLVSFLDRPGVAAVAGLDGDTSLVGWMHIHDCVTAASTPFMPDLVTDYLRSRQHGGSWAGYWWEHDAFPTWLVTEALRRRPAPGDAERLEQAEARACAWIEDAELSAFDLAFALRVLVAGSPARHARSIAAAAEALARRQRGDGSWPSGARLRVPAWRRLDPQVGEEMVRLDHRAAFSTAAVIGALAELRDATS